MPILKGISDVIRIAKKIGISIKTANEEYTWKMDVLEERDGNFLVRVGYMDRSADFIIAGNKPLSGRIDNMEMPKEELEPIFNLLMFPLDFFLRSQDERIVEGNVDESIGKVEPLGERKILGMMARGYRVKISDLAKRYLTDMDEAEYWLVKIGDYDVAVDIKGIFSKKNVVEVFLNSIEIR